MIGAIIGDIVGSQFEWQELKKKEFKLFTHNCTYTDDSLMTLAIAEAFVLRRGEWRSDGFREFLISRMVKMGREHQAASWGERFYKWFMESPKPYGSMGNGAAMRISPVGWISDSEDDVRYFSALVTEVSHDHPDAVLAAEAVAMAIYLARNGAQMEEIRERMTGYYPELCNMTLDKIRPDYGIDPLGRFITCAGSVPQAILAFLESVSFEDAVRNAISLGGDTDTQGAIAGSIAEAYYGVDIDMEERALEYLTDKLLTIYYAFSTVKRKRLRRHAL